MPISVIYVTAGHLPPVRSHTNRKGEMKSFSQYSAWHVLFCHTAQVGVCGFEEIVVYYRKLA